MKTQVLRTSIMVVLVAAAGYAQRSTPVRATIPFNFVAGSATLPAGHYTAYQDGPGLITLRSDTKVSAIMFAPIVECAAVQTVSRLVFHRYGSNYVLSQVWTEGSRCGRQGTVTPRERKLAARQKAPDETILVALR